VTFAAGLTEWLDASGAPKWGKAAKSSARAEAHNFKGLVDGELFAILQGAVTRAAAMVRMNASVPDRNKEVLLRGRKVEDW